jgi:hypothetical protein
MVKIYFNSDDYVCELWEGSTKHPDAVFHFRDFVKSAFVEEDNYNIFQWLLEIASKMNFPHHAKEIAEYALEIYGKPLEDFVEVRTDY